MKGDWIMMKTRRMQGMALLFALVFLAGATQAAEFYYTYKSGTWHANSEISGVEYTGLAHTLTASTAECFAIGPNGVDYVEWSSGPGWHVSGQATGETVLSVASDVLSGGTRKAYYVRASDGALRQMWRYSSGTWDQGTLGGDTAGISYNLVTTNYSEDNKIFAARSGGGLDYIRYQSGWKVSVQLNTDKTYTSITGNYDGSYDVLGSLVGGGLYWDEYGESESTLSTDLYAQVVTNRKGRSFFALKADGTVQLVDDSDDDKAFSLVDLNSNAYSVIEAGLAADSVYAARSDGGLDYIYHDGSSWVTDQVDSNANHEYLGIARDAAATNKDAFGVVIPEPTTMALLVVGGSFAIFRRRGK